MDSGTRLSGSSGPIFSRALEGAAVTPSRDAFLERVRQAVEAGNRAGHTAGIPQRGATGYQGAGPDPATRFCEQLIAAGGEAYRVPDAESAVTRLLALAQT